MNDKIVIAKIVETRYIKMTERQFKAMVRHQKESPSEFFETIIDVASTISVEEVDQKTAGWPAETFPADADWSDVDWKIDEEGNPLPE